MLRLSPTSIGLNLPQFNPAPLMQFATDCSWLERAENCLIFGPSGD